MLQHCVSRWNVYILQSRLRFVFKRLTCWNPQALSKVCAEIVLPLAFFTFTFTRNNPTPDEERLVSDIVILCWSSAFAEAICRIVQCKKFFMLPLFYVMLLCRCLPSIKVVRTWKNSCTAMEWKVETCP